MLRAYRPWLPVVLWMGFIFTMSTSLGASDNTSRFIEPLLRALLPHAAPETIDWAHFLIRKAGHLTEYAILALLLRRALRATLHPGSSGLKVSALALLIAAAYASTDEFHQTFVPGRTPSPHDVLIDTTGAFVALAVAAVWQKRHERHP
jgi:VanZ family protein